jgi:hypothetical protein
MAAIKELQLDINPNDDPAFQKWMAKVNLLCTIRIAATTDDLPNQTWRAWYDSEMTATEALDAALANDRI